MDAPLRRRARRRPPSVRSSSPPDAASSAATLLSAAPSSRSSLVSGERTVRRLRLSKALTIPESSTVSEACRRMAAMRADAALLTNKSGLLSGIITDKDIATRVVAEGLRPERTVVSKIMTRHPVFVEPGAPAIKALQTMVQGKFRHLPIVENGEVVGLLDIIKCLYDAISRTEKVAEQGSALAAAVEGVQVQCENDFTGTPQEQILKPSLSTIITESTKFAVASPSDPVYVATKKMRDFRVSSVVIATGSKLHGILTSKDVLVRVVAQNLSPELTLAEKVMTPNPECATLDTTILDALHIMHDGKFLHLPVLDSDGCIAACVDVLQVTQAAVSIIEGGAEAASDVGNMMMQKFWDSALAMEPPDVEYDTQSEFSTLVASEYVETTKFSHSSPGHGNVFSFKFKDSKGQIHRFSCVADKLDELLSTIMLRIGPDVSKDKIQLLYEDDEGDQVLLTIDDDLVGAINQARLVGSKVVKLHIVDFTVTEVTKSTSDLAVLQRNRSTSLRLGVLAGAVVVVGVGMMIYMMRTKL